MFYVYMYNVHCTMYIVQRQHLSYSPFLYNDILMMRLLTLKTALKIIQCTPTYLELCRDIYMFMAIHHFHF